jgi:hypothetical protein
MRLTRDQIHEQVYLYSLIFIAVLLPYWVFTLTMAQVLLFMNWMAEGRFREKWERFRQNKALWFFLALYLVHLAGLLWSSDIGYGLKYIRIKLSMIMIPLVVGTSRPLTRKMFNLILLFFVVGVFISTMASIIAMLGWFNVEVAGYRDLSLFQSHIRFSLMIVLSILVATWYIFFEKNSITRATRIYYMVCLIWFPMFLILLKSLSGIVILGFLAFFLLLRAVFEIRDAAIRFMVFVPVIMIPLFSVAYIGHAVAKYYSFDQIKLDEIDTETARGNPYVNHPNLREVENGHYVWLYLCEKELEEEWNKISEVEYTGTTTNGNSIKGTLIRYLTSRGLRKDASGVAQLSAEEVTAIEHGVANYIYLKKFRLYPRIYEVIWEFDRYRLGYSPNEKSVVQRILYLEAGWHIARDNLLKGVGTGDVKQAFKDHYNKIDSPLEEKWRRRAHNQFLTFLITFGIPGFILAVVALVAPLFMAGRQRSFLAVGFFILMLISMLNEDTLETSIGACLIAFFYSLFVFGPDTPWLKRKIFGGNA